MKDENRNMIPDWLDRVAGRASSAIINASGAYTAYLAISKDPPPMWFVWTMVVVNAINLYVALSPGGGMAGPKESGGIDQ